MFFKHISLGTLEFKESESHHLPCGVKSSGVGAMRLPSRAARALELSCELLNLKPDDLRGW